MLLPLAGRRLYYDLVGPEGGPVVCITHSLASDGGSWTEQVPALLAVGFRVLRLDMRGHGGSDAVEGDYTMSQLAGDVASVLDALGFERVHYIGLSIGGMIGQAFALEHGHRLISALWCDTLPASPAGAAEIWGPRVTAVRAANSLEPIAEASMDRYLSPAFREKIPAVGSSCAIPLSARRRKVISAVPRQSSISTSSHVCRRSNCRCWSCVARRTPAPRPVKIAALPALSRVRAMRKSRACAISQMSKRRMPLTASCSAGLMPTAAPAELRN